MISATHSDGTPRLWRKPRPVCADAQALSGGVSRSRHPCRHRSHQVVDGFGAALLSALPLTLRLTFNHPQVGLLLLAREGMAGTHGLGTQLVKCAGKADVTIRGAQA